MVYAKITVKNEIFTWKKFLPFSHLTTKNANSSSRKLVSH